MRNADFERLMTEMDALAAASGTTHAEAPWRNPVAVYRDPEHLHREEARLFDALPLVAASSSELAEPHAFVAIEQGGAPLLVVRQPDGSVRALLNVCRHRASQLVATGTTGCSRRFTCPFHAWSYGPDGRLLGVTDQEGFAGLDRDSHGLVELPCEERHGLVWVGATPGAPIDVASHLGPLDAELSALCLADFVAERTVRLEAEMNWKLVVDGFLETYHIRFLHPETLSPHLPSNCAQFTGLGPHGRMTAPRNFYDPSRPRSPRDFLEQVLIVYQVFPNTILTWLTDHFELWQIQPVPGHVDRASVRVSLLVRPEELDRKAAWDKNLRILEDTVFAEDWSAAASTQRALRSAAAPDHLVFGRNEPALQHYHRQLAAVVG